VIVQIAEVSRSELQPLIREAWQHATPRATAKSVPLKTSRKKRARPTLPSS
jgi:hypothetical protein